MKKRGRPPKSLDRKRWQRLDLRVSEAEKEAFRLAADNANQDLSVWIRVQLHRAATESLPNDMGGVQENGTGKSQADSDRASSLR